MGRNTVAGSLAALARGGLLEGDAGELRELEVLSACVLAESPPTPSPQQSSSIWAHGRSGGVRQQAESVRLLGEKVTDCGLRPARCALGGLAGRGRSTYTRALRHLSIMQHAHIQHAHICARPLALAGLAALSLCVPVYGLGQEPAERATAEQAVSPIRIVGSVQGPDGRPVPGAVVVTSAGGQAVTGVGGEFSLDVEAPHAAERLQVTAVASLGGVSHAGSVLTEPLARHASNDAGVVAVAATSTCEPSWLPTFGGEPGPNWTVEALASFDDGHGPALYVGGSFTYAGGVPANYVARWDGSTWSPLSSGMDGDVRALLVFDDGAGAALYAGGFFETAGGVPARSIAKWDGVSWSPLLSGVSGAVETLEVFDDGGGPELFAAGHFDSAGGVPASNVAKWDGSNWSALGSGTDDWVLALQSFDGGGGAALYAGGMFHAAGGVAANRIAKWDGVSWSPLAGGFDSGFVYTLEVFDDGGGPALYAGGLLNPDGIYKWDGSGWSAVGSGAGFWVNALTTFDDGGGPALYAGGSSIAKWDGSDWSSIESGAEGLANALAVFGEGEDRALYAAGYSLFEPRIAKWDGAAWSWLGDGLSGSVEALVVFDGGGKPALYAGGVFVSAGGVAANRIARWDGSAWSPLGSGSASTVLALGTFDDGGGPALYAGGDFTADAGVGANHLARWDGSSWSALPGIEGGTVRDLVVYDDGAGNALYAAGYFLVAGEIDVQYVAKWDGSAWSGVVSGLEGPGESVTADALAVFDDGTGEALYVGGLFFHDDGSWYSLGSWDGSSWSPLENGVIAPVKALAVFDDGGGEALYAGGGGAPCVARWDGSSWSPLGSGIGGSGVPEVRVLSAFDDGGGPVLYAGGRFETAGGVAALNVASWDGSAWSPLGGGITPGFLGIPVRAFGTFDDGGGAALYAGGTFASALDSGDSYLAKWGCPPPITEVPGCFGNPASLSALSDAASTGQPFALRFRGPAASGVAFLSFGLDGTNASGCGIPVPGIGEILLLLSPGPFPLAEEPIRAGSAAFRVPVPRDPSLVGLKILLQAAGLSVPVGPPIELSTGLAVTITG